MANFTVDENCTSDLNQVSTSVWLTCTFALLSALNIFLSITALLGNALILVALHKESSLHPPTKLLFRCLAATDLSTGLISQPLFAVAVIARITGINSLDKGYVVTGFILCGISVFTSTAISVDRLLALLLGLRYRQVVTLRRTRAVIVGFSVICVPSGTMHLWSPGISNYWIGVIFLTVLSLIISISSYMKIYLKLRQHQAQVQGQPNGGEITINIAGYRKTVSSIAWVQLALVICFAPYVIVFMLLKMYSNKTLIFVVHLATVTLVYLNFSLNPILYCWKIEEVRQAVKDTIRQFCCL